ncbi:proline-rich family protein [Artemisia annua]|uniref:Proline-rich family protein n=1 Tax=Artemisia annua TaxID=35608 RepID=A0A2U1M168_ARTAN|nr:proline-rich family protein [Artemisia annua]
MNRSFRAPEKEMPNLRNLREKEEELGLFLEMKKHEKERLSDFHSSVASRNGNSNMVRKTGADEFLNSENDKNDYDWLMTPPGTPLFPSLEMESQKTVMNQNGTSKAHISSLKSRLSSNQQEANGRNNLVSRPRAASPALGAGQRRPSSGGSGSGSGSGSRPTTPTNSRPALGTQTRASSNPVSKTKVSSTTTVRPARSSTPTSRSTLSSSKPTVPARSSTPTSRATGRSSTPTSRPSLSTTKPAPRASTPPRRTPTLSTVNKASAPLVRSPSTVTNSANSPNARPRPWKPQEMPGYTLDAPPNLRTSLNDRPISNMRGRPGAPSSRSSSIEPVPNGRVRRQSCSPSRGRLPTGVTRKSGTSVPIPALNRAYAKANDNVNPGSYGTKMVERVINMRKLMPPKQDDKHSPQSNLSGKSSSPDSGFGRSISKKSLDMAMRHMDIRRTIPGNLRPLMSKIPASSMYSVRTGPTRNRMNSVSDSLATSSNASSEMSVNNTTHQIDDNVDNESNSEKGVHSPASIRGR